jgi:hypothetical protein
MMHFVLYRTTRNFSHISFKDPKVNSTQWKHYQIGLESFANTAHNIAFRIICHNPFPGDLITNRSRRTQQ